MRYILSLFFVAIICSLSLPAYAQQRYDYDVAATVGSIVFVPPQIRAGEPLRIYGTVVNVGNKDITGHVGFYQGTILIGDPQPFSLKSNGVLEEVWVDWIPPEGTYNIMMTILQTKPEDQNASNNVSVTPMLTVRKPAPPPPQVQEQPQRVIAVPPPSTQTSAPLATKDEPPVSVAPATQQPPVPKAAPAPKSVSPSSNPIAPSMGNGTEKIIPATKQNSVLESTAKDLKATSTSMVATTTDATMPLFQQYSEELKKAAEKKSEMLQDAALPGDKTYPNDEDDGTLSGEKESNRFLMIGSSAAVTLLLIGLIFLKRSGVV